MSWRKRWSSLLRIEKVELFSFRRWFNSLKRVISGLKQDNAVHLFALPQVKNILKSYLKVQDSRIQQVFRNNLTGIANHRIPTLCPFPKSSYHPLCTLWGISRHDTFPCCFILLWRSQFSKTKSLVTASRTIQRVLVAFLK